MSSETRVKYPRTPHLPSSPGFTPDDEHLSDLSGLRGEIVVTEKMDGENTTLYRDGLHARSVDSRHHESRAWVKSLHASIASQIPPDMRICGENVFARHSLAYDSLPSYFMVFSIWDGPLCLSWDDTLTVTSMLSLTPVSEIYRGPFTSLEDLHARFLAYSDTSQAEGYVVRTTSAFTRDDFPRSIAKWVRPSHVTTDQHWMSAPVVPNRLA